MKPSNPIWYNNSCCFNIIDKEILANDINRYIAPYFTLMKQLSTDAKQLEFIDDDE